MLDIYEWQAECLENWEKNNYRGIVKAVTGAGKTVLALTAVQLLEEAINKELRVKIVVPQLFLADQWREEIKQRHNYNASADEIGFYHGKRKDSGKKFMIVDRRHVNQNRDRQGAAASRPDRIHGSLGKDS